MTENKKLHARLTAVEQSRSAMTIKQIIDRLDNVIRVVNNHESDNYQVGQSLNDIQQELVALRQTVDAWNEDEGVNDEHHQEDITQNDVVDFPVQENPERIEDSPPGLSRPASIAGSATTVIMSALELPLFKGSKRVFVRRFTSICHW